MSPGGATSAEAALRFGSMAGLLLVLFGAALWQAVNLNGTRPMHPDTRKYNEQQEPRYEEICDLLAREIESGLPGAENEVWHAHPVWFIEGNPIVGYSKQKAGIRLMFWSGADFGEADLDVVGKKFKDASVFYNDVSEVSTRDLQRWLAKANDVQWDYRNLAKRKGRLERLK